MAELNCGPIQMVIQPPSSDTPEDRHEKDKNKPDDMAQVAALVMELLQPLPTLSLRVQEGPGTPASSTAVDGHTLAALDAQDRKRYLSGERKTGPATTLLKAKAVAEQHEKAGEKPGLSPVNHRSSIALATEETAAATTTPEADPASKKKVTLRDVDDALAHPPFHGLPHREERSGIGLERQMMNRMSQTREMPAQFTDHSEVNTRSDGWTYQFRSWGQEHAVRVSLPERSATSGDTTLSLRPTSELVEYRLHVHPSAPLESETWLMQERDDHQGQNKRQPDSDNANEEQP